MKILVVDDTKNIRLLLTKCLEMEGYTVETAGDGRTAMEMLTRGQYDLAFLDIKMPQFSGTEVLRRIREMGIWIPVIIITAYATVKNAVECTNLGAVAYLQKPFTAEKIHSVMAEMLVRQPAGTGLDAILNLARRRMDEKQYPEAEKVLKSALVEYSLSPELHFLLARVCTALGRPQEAEGHRKTGEALR